MPRNACCPMHPAHSGKGRNCLHCWSAAEMAAECTTSPTALLNPKPSAAFIAGPACCGSARIAHRRVCSKTHPGLGCGRAACCGMSCARLRCGGQACRPSAAAGDAGAARRSTQRQTRSSGVGAAVEHQHRLGQPPVSVYDQGRNNTGGYARIGHFCHFWRQAGPPLLPAKRRCAEHGNRVPLAVS